MFCLGMQNGRGAAPRPRPAKDLSYQDDAESASTARSTREELVDSLVRGERRFHQIPKDLPPKKAVRSGARRWSG